MNTSSEGIKGMRPLDDRKRYHITLSSHYRKALQFVRNEYFKIHGEEISATKAIQVSIHAAAADMGFNDPLPAGGD